MYSRGNSFMQQSVARGMQAAGENGGGANMAFMGMGMNAAGNMMGGVQQPSTGNSYQPNFGGGMNQNQGYQNQGKNCIWRLYEITSKRKTSTTS